MLDDTAILAVWIGTILGSLGLIVLAGLLFKRLFARETAEHARQVEEIRRMIECLNAASDRRCVRDTLTVHSEAGRAGESHGP
mgnify:CR=1 FL=1